MTAACVADVELERLQNHPLHRENLEETSMNRGSKVLCPNEPQAEYKRYRKYTQTPQPTVG